MDGMWLVDVGQTTIVGYLIYSILFLVFSGIYLILALNERALVLTEIGGDPGHVGLEATPTYLAVIACTLILVYIICGRPTVNMVAHMVYTFWSIATLCFAIQVVVLLCPTMKELLALLPQHAACLCIPLSNLTITNMSVTCAPGACYCDPDVLQCKCRVPYVTNPVYMLTTDVDNVNMDLFSRHHLTYKGDIEVWTSANAMTSDDVPWLKNYPHVDSLLMILQMSFVMTVLRFPVSIGTTYMRDKVEKDRDKNGEISDEETGKKGHKADGETGKKGDKADERTGKSDDKADEGTGKKGDKADEGTDKKGDKADERTGKTGGKADEGMDKKGDEADEETGKQGIEYMCDGVNLCLFSLSEGLDAFSLLDDVLTYPDIFIQNTHLLNSVLAFISIAILHLNSPDVKKTVKIVIMLLVNIPFLVIRIVIYNLFSGIELQDSYAGRQLSVFTFFILKELLVIVLTIFDIVFQVYGHINEE